MKTPALNILRSLQIFQVLRFGALFVTSIILAQLLPQDVVGQYETVMMIGSAFSFFWVSGIINTFIPVYKSEPAESAARLIGVAFVLLSVVSVLTNALLYFIAPSLYGVSGSLLLYYLIFNIFQAPAFLAEYILLVKNRPSALLSYGMLAWGAQIAAIGLPLLAGYSLEEAVALLAVTGVARYIFLIFLVRRFGKLGWDGKLARSFLSRALPVIGGLVLGGSMPYIDSHFIKFYYPDAATFALYQYGAREMPIVLLMANALSNVMSGELAGLHGNELRQGLERLKSRSLSLMNGLFAISLFLMLAAPWLYEKVYGARFAGAAHIFGIFLLLGIGRLIFPQTVLLAMHRNRQLFRISAIEWGINIVLNFILIHYYGMAGIAWATVGAFLAERVMQAAFLNKLGIPPGMYIPLKQWAIWSAVMVAVYVGVFVVWS